MPYFSTVVLIEVQHQRKGAKKHKSASFDYQVAFDRKYRIRKVRSDDNSDYYPDEQKNVENADNLVEDEERAKVLLDDVGQENKSVKKITRKKTPNVIKNRRNRGKRQGQAGRGYDSFDLLKKKGMRLIIWPFKKGMQFREEDVSELKL
ncbi:hypothetical protein ILUMI_09166 [Ignelater luminosus]|uniref:Uncharacterized protein n=1 Tax=Ignelater luminosus TaxID=2038154 RepID=A0A8K0D9T3_IGNLU|nr:hypothetical protein ILUMI_09166 [Ignelater luminosus]